MTSTSQKAEPFDAVDVIRTKRDKGVLSPEQIDWTIHAYTRGVVADEQMAALNMAILLNGMDRSEISRWTAAMIASGERMDFSSLRRPDGGVKATSDKHSTGGVGDKITLPLAPLVAVFGVAVPQLSGRGLGHTGGTLDKLESIPGWRAALSNDEMMAQLQDVGAVICAAGAGLAPADKKLYSLRDVTGTVEAIPLIASSIMSKKIAEGTGSLVLDVKVGSGAFMKDEARARELAETMVALGKDAGVNTVALLTNMNTPLGLTAGNAIEVEESVEVLAGGGPEDVVELTVRLAEEMLACAGVSDADPAAALKDGRAMDVWNRMIAGPGRRSAGEAACGEGVRDHLLPGRRRPRGTRRVGRGRGSLAPRGGPRPQGGHGAGRRRRAPACQAGRRCAGRGAAHDAAYGHSGEVRPGQGGARASGHDRAGGVAPGTAAHHRPHRLGTVQAINDFILAAAGQPWVLFLVLACCVIDGFFPPIPSESVVVGLAAVASTADVPNPWLLMAVAALGAFTGDNTAYLIGRSVGTRRWRWMRGPRMQRAFRWAGRELRKRPASLILVARFVPIGRVAVNLTAGATHYSRPRFIGLTVLSAIAVGQLFRGHRAVFRAVVRGQPPARGGHRDRLRDRAGHHRGHCHHPAARAHSRTLGGGVIFLERA